MRSLLDATLLGLAGLLLSAPAAAEVEIEWVHVGEPGNACQVENSFCFGGVTYSYVISKYETTNAQYTEFLNAVDPNGLNTLGLYRPEMASHYSGGIDYFSQNPAGQKYAAQSGRHDRPVNYVDIWDAMRFSNWIENGQGDSNTETGSYTLLGGSPIPINSQTISRSVGATTFISSEDEWYKAAYYAGSTVGYFEYPTGSDTGPACTQPSGASNRANCISGAFDLTNVGSYPGSPSPVGTFDQGGNVKEWNEPLLGDLSPRTKGGSFIAPVSALSASSLGSSSASSELYYLGFRLAGFIPPTEGPGVTAFEIDQLTAPGAGPGNRFGYSLALSGDTLVVGAYWEDGIGSKSGAAYLFEHSETSGQWEYRATLIPGDVAAGDNFGRSVGVSGDSVVVGSFMDADGGPQSGSAYVFVEPATGWAGTLSHDAKLMADDSTAGDRFGRSVAISGDVVVVGSEYQDGTEVDSGAAYVFAKPGSVWSGNLTQTARLRAADGATGDRFGSAVAISGETIVVGAPYDDDTGIESGAAYVFVEPGGGWSGNRTEKTKLTASDSGVGDRVGRSVAIDANTLVVGGGFSSPGAAYIFTEPIGGWSGPRSEDAKLVAADGTASDNLGVSVAISGDIVVSGANLDSAPAMNSGSAYIFIRPLTGWVGTIEHSTKITATNGDVGDRFGKAVAASGDVVVISSPDQGAETSSFNAFTPVAAGTSSNADSAYIMELVACGDNQVESGEECEGTEACTEICLFADLILAGTALGGHTLELGIDGETVSTTTLAGQSAEDAIQALADAVNNHSSLQSAGISATALGTSLVIQGENSPPTLLSNDPGFEGGQGSVPISALSSWAFVILILLLTLAGSRNARRPEKAI